MTMQQDIDRIIGVTAYDVEGDKIGKVGRVYLDNITSRPEWVTVHTGFFGTHENFIPLDRATFDAEGNLRVPFGKSVVKEAPSIDPAGPEGGLTGEQERELYRHYGIDYDGDADGDLAGRELGDAGRTRDAEGLAAGGRGRDTSGPTTDDAMTRSEEQLTVGTQRREAGRARLRKYVVTEEVTQTVPVSHEEVRIEREPITEANRDRAMSGPDISEEEHEVTLYAEEPVVGTQAVPVERVRLGTEKVTEQRTVGGQVRKEQIDTDADVDERGRSARR